MLFILKSSFFFEYIIFRSVQNVCIECLWVDITTQVGAYLSEFFVQLELRHSLNVNNIHHIWLLQYLFLPIMLVHGIWGDQLPDEEELSTEELEVYGVDWEDLWDNKLL